jgi:endonuclease-3
MKPAKVEEIFRRFSAANPEPKGELSYKSPFTLLVAVVLSAQATDTGVNKATPALFAAADTPEKMAALGVAKLRRFIRTIGLFNSKAKHIVALSKILRDRYGGRVPHDREALESLPGVGRKTANIILNIAFGESTVAVDTHVFRVANRTGLAKGKTPRAVEDGLERAIPSKWKRHAHHWLILHGRYVCKARNPGCPCCPINDLCEFKDKTRAEVPRAVKSSPRAYRT